MDRTDELKKAGFEVHRRIEGSYYKSFGQRADEYVVEFEDHLYRLHYDETCKAWYKKSSAGGCSIFYLDEVRPFLLETRGVSNKGFKYKVYVHRPADRDKWTLNVDNAPGSWYLKTLGDRSGPIALDYGQNWYLENYDEIKAEILERWPFCALNGVEF